MKRRDFLRVGGWSGAGLALAPAQLAWLVQDAQAASAASGTPWTFGVMADTQWSNRTDLANPGTCAVGIINALNQRFIAAGARFVVQVGDLVDSESWTHPTRGGTERTLPYRAAAAQALYDAGIGFFPVRGNHEASATAAAELRTLFPQTRGQGGALWGVDRVIPSTLASLEGLSYAVDIGNVRIVLLDQFTRLDGSGSTNNNVLDQLDWVDGVLSSRASDQHAFVFAHKNLIGQNHADCLFGSSATSNTAGRNRFIASLQANRVASCIGGHDHMHHRSLVRSPDGSAAAPQIICASNSYKFYIPKSTPNDSTGRESVVAQELFTIGYYLFHVDGPCVTVEYWSSSHGADYGDLDLQYPPASYAFFLRERFGCSLNGRRFDIANGGSYTAVRDSFGTTSAAILAGSNADIADDADYNRRDEIKTVQTGWKERPAGAASAVLKLWGINDNLNLFDASLTGALPAAAGPASGDAYVLSLSYDAAAVRPTALRGGSFCLQARSADGNWTNAVHLNAGGTKKFVYGPWKPGYALGSYGVDPTARSVWAVIDRDGEFAAL